MKVLVIDVGGSHIKLLATGRKPPIKIPSGPEMTASQMVRRVREAVDGWTYEALSIGYPGVVQHGKPLSEPRISAVVESASGSKMRSAVRSLLSMTAIQALGSYKGGRMLFLGLGIGRGSALIIGGVLKPKDLAHLPYKNGRKYEDYLGKAGLKRFGKKKWRRHVMECRDPAEERA
jgi:polyphosphate glucokinase